MEPINYSLDVQTPFQSALQGYQAGAAIRNDQLLQQQQMAAQAQQKQQQEVLKKLISNPNPTADDYAAATLLVPGMKEQFKQSWDMRSSVQQQNDLQHVGQVYSAIVTGQPQVASDLLKRRAEAMRNSNDEAGAKNAEAMAGTIDAHPQFARSLIGMKLASLPGGDKVISNVAALNTDQRAAEQAPADLAKKQADAAKAGIDAKYAEQGVVLDLQKKGWDIRHIQEDIGFKKEANRIALMNAAAAREGNALKREELGIKIQEARTALDDKIRAKVADTESAATAIDNTLNTIERLKRNPALNDVLGSLEGSEYYPTQLAQGAAKVMNLTNPLYTPTSADDRSDAKALIESLGSQIFLSQIPAMKGSGSLSNAEGDKLQAALQNLKRTQSETQFRANLDEAARLLKKGRETLSKRSGVPLSAPDTPAAPGSRPPLSSFFKPQGG